MKSLQILLTAFLVASAAMWSGCSDSAPSGPVAGLGGGTITKYVAIGNSLTAGYQSNGLYASAQNYAFPKLIASQIQMAGASIANFELPWWSDPGTPGADGKASRYEVITLAGPGGSPLIGPRGLPAGSPTNLTLARPYDDLGVPGAVIFDFLDNTDFATKALQRSNPLFLAILRNSALGSSILAQARALHPDLVTFWLGNNDVLGFATSGGVSPSAPTSAAAFAFLYSQALDSLRAALPNARIVVANIPDVTTIPFFTTLGPKIAASLPSGILLRYQMHGETGVGSGSTRFADAVNPLITLTGSAYASLLGHPTGQWYRDKGIPVAAPIDTTKPFGLDPRNPWPDALVLDAGEQLTAGSAVSSFNITIAAVAGARNAALVDINGFFNIIRVQGFYSGGEKFTADYLSGGLFSLDGVHPSSRGQGVVANEFIKVMNARFAMSIPLVDISTIPGIPTPVSKSAQGGKVYPVIPYSAFKDFNMLFGAGI